MTYDHALHVAQEQYDSRAPRDRDEEPCDNCLLPFSAHESNEVWDWCCADGREYTPLTEESERELRAAMRGDI